MKDNIQSLNGRRKIAPLLLIIVYEYFYCFSTYCHCAVGGGHSAAEKPVSRSISHINHGQDRSQVKIEKKYVVELPPKPLWHTPPQSGAQRYNLPVFRPEGKCQVISRPILQVFPVTWKILPHLQDKLAFITAFSMHYGKSFTKISGLSTIQ